MHWHIDPGRRCCRHDARHPCRGARCPAAFIAAQACVEGKLADMSDKALMAISGTFGEWQVYRVCSEGYRPAEVTLGGEDAAGFGWRGRQTRQVRALYLIAEVAGVTIGLGRYSLQQAQP